MVGLRFGCHRLGLTLGPVGGWFGPSWGQFALGHVLGWSRAGLVFLGETSGASLYVSMNRTLDVVSRVGGLRYRVEKCHDGI